VTHAARRSKGFTLTEVIVTMVIIGALAAVLVPTVFSRAKVARADAVIAELSNIESAMYLYRNDVGRFPYRVDYLYRFPTAFVPAHPQLMDACATALSANNQAKYRGPYINRPIVLLNETTLPRYVLSTGDSVNAILSIQNNFQGQRVINIEVTGPELDVAKLIDAKVDGVEGASAGKLQYTDNGGAGANVDMEKLLTWTIPVRSGNC
jgi:type II secretion system protein G